MAPRAGNKIGVPSTFETEVFGSKCTAVKKVLATLLVLFGAPVVIRHPRDDLAPGGLCLPCPPRCKPGSIAVKTTIEHIKENSA